METTDHVVAEPSSIRHDDFPLFALFFLVFHTSVWSIRRDIPFTSGFDLSPLNRFTHRPRYQPSTTPDSSHLTSSHPSNAMSGQIPILPPLAVSSLTNPNMPPLMHIPIPTSQGPTSNADPVLQYAAPARPPPPPLDTMRAYRACLNCRNRKSKCDLDSNHGRPVSDISFFCSRLDLSDHRFRKGMKGRYLYLPNHLHQLSLPLDLNLLLISISLFM